MFAHAITFGVPASRPEPRRDVFQAFHCDAGQRSAILYSVILSCERHGKEPLAYLRDVLSRLPRLTIQDDLDVLTPSLWSPPRR